MKAMSKRRHPRKKKKQRTEPQDAAAKKNDPAERKVLFVPEVKPTPSNSSESKKPWYKTLDGWKVRLELIAIPFVIGYAVITFFQWRDLRHNFEVDQRAWLKVDVGMPATLSQQAPVVVTVRYVGKSPALKLFGGVIVQVVDAKSAPAFPPGKAELRNVLVNMLFPSDLTTFTSGRTPNNPDGTLRALIDDEMQGLAAGNTYLAAFGIIAYQDQFGDHWTRFCTPKSYQTGPKDFYWRSCVAWNSAGDGLTKWGSPSDTN
jgi:hypothetical protein